MLCKMITFHNPQNNIIIHQDVRDPFQTIHDQLIIAKQYLPTIDNTLYNPQIVRRLESLNSSIELLHNFLDQLLLTETSEELLTMLETHPLLIDRPEFMQTIDLQRLPYGLLTTEEKIFSHLPSVYQGYLLNKLSGIKLSLENLAYFNQMHLIEISNAVDQLTHKGIYAATQSFYNNIITLIKDKYNVC